MPRTSPGGKKCTEARHDVILRLLEARGPATAGDVTRMLRLEVKAGTIDWPKAPWPGARQQPYAGGTYQMLSQMVHKGMVEGTSSADHRAMRFRPVPATYRRHAKEALEAKKGGMTQKDIAEHLGVSVSHVSSLLKDPTGEKERARKRGYCPGCGAKKDLLADACKKCGSARAEARLPDPDAREVVLAVARDYQAVTGCEVVLGVLPNMTRVIRVGTRRGIVEHVVQDGQTWEHAVNEHLGLAA